MAKNLEIALLFDFYGDMLTDKQRDVVELYYDNDLSLSEIAENEGLFVTISIFRSMREKGLISSDEYDQIHTRIANNSAAVLSDLYR